MPAKHATTQRLSKAATHTTHPLPPRPSSHQNARADSTSAFADRQARPSAPVASTSASASVTSNQTPEMAAPRAPKRTPSPLGSSATTEEPPVGSTSNAPPGLPLPPSVSFSLPSPVSVQSPFADFDQTLGTFVDGTFSFSLDLDAKGKERVLNDSSSGAGGETGGEGAITPNTLDSFSSRGSPALGIRSPLDGVPGVTPSYRHYAGPFNPFETANDGTADWATERSTSPAASDEAFTRKSSRFGFARPGRLPSVTAEMPPSSSSTPFPPGVFPSDRLRAPSNTGIVPPTSAADLPLPEATSKPPLSDTSSLWSGINLDASYSGSSLPSALAKSLALPPETLHNMHPLPPPSSSHGGGMASQPMPSVPNSSSPLPPPGFNFSRPNNYPAPHSQSRGPPPFGKDELYGHILNLAASSSGGAQRNSFNNTRAFLSGFSFFWSGKRDELLT
jgi:hypothetical protein